MKEKAKRFLKPYFIIPAAILLLAIIIFGGWFLIPSSPLDIVVLDKTVPAGASGTADDPILSFRKHYGLFWLLDTLKYKNPQTGNAYDYETDYYGSVLSGDLQPEEKSMANLGRTPDMVYLADAYGADTKNTKDGNKGISYDDISAAAVAHENGATLIAETDILASATEDSVKGELQSTFGFKYTGWTGRYITDMADLSDVPTWAQSLHESQFGRPWDYKGAGMLLVSEKEEIIVLEEKDFDGDMLSISMNPDYEKEFGKHAVNYYNWFEIVTPEYGTETIASYRMNLNDSGKEKFSKISNETDFPAVVRTKNAKAPAYYFAGDFNDYVSFERYSHFLFSLNLYQMFSYERAGDITNFYWNFYTPLMDTILKQTKENKENVVQPAPNSQASFRIEGNGFQLKNGDEWQAFPVKGFNVNGVMPGDGIGDDTRDISVYQDYFKQIAEMGGNTVRAYDLMPPEFYRALCEHNLENPEQPVYFLQTIPLPNTVTGDQAVYDEPKKEIKKYIEYVINSIHSKNSEAAEQKEKRTYSIDAAAYLIGFIAQIDDSLETIKAINEENRSPADYQGDYISVYGGSAAQALMAELCDYIYLYQQKTFEYITPVGAAGNPRLIGGSGWVLDYESVSFDLNSLDASDKTGGSFFVSYPLTPYDDLLLNHTKDLFGDYTDASGTFAYGGYVREVKKLHTDYPVLADNIVLSTNTNAFEKETSINGLTETQQGNGLVRMLQAVDTEGYLGGLIGDFADCWSKLSDEQSKFILPEKDNPLWHDMLDYMQNTGVVSIEPKNSGEIGMSVKDTGRMQEMQVSIDPSYLYVTAVFDSEINYDQEQLIIGLDTYQRNNGEYLYDSDYFATSLSGMEYTVKFESKNTAALYVIPSYNRSNGKYSSKETYKGKYDYVCQLVYGPFDDSANHFYQTGSTIHLRIPLSLLNITDPSKMLVLNDTRSQKEIDKDAFGLQTMSTDGIIFSVLIADKGSKDTAYIFPESKKSGGYKTFKWSAWTQPEYVFRQKASFKILQRYFTSNY